MRRISALIIACCTAGLAHAASYPTAQSTATSPGAALSGLADLNAGSYGAKCDGVTNDAVAINAAFTAARARATVTGSTVNYPIGKLAKITLPLTGKPCLITSTINVTGFYGAGLVLEFWGSSILCQTSGTPCIDATGMGQGSIRGLNIIGGTTNSPNIGLVLGRITNNSVGADHNYIERPTITGSFTLTPYFNNQSETTLVDHAYFVNAAPNAYGGIWDGSNKFNIQSAFTGQTFPQNTYISFNENTCIDCYIGTTGASSIPIYMGTSARHKFINSYAYYSTSSTAVPEPAVYLDFYNGSVDYLDLDVHLEDFSGNHNLTSLVQFGGASAVAMHGLHMQDNYPEQSGPIFSRASGVSTVSLQDVDLHMGTLAGNSPSWWDLASAYSVSGRIYNQDGTYTAPGTFTGVSCVGAGGCTNSIVLPANISASTISNPGGIILPTVAGLNNYSSGINLPTVTVAAPPSGGQQATVTVNYLDINGSGYLNGTNSSTVGTGYSVNDVLTLTGGTCSVAGKYTVTSIGTGGAISGFTITTYGTHCSVVPPYVDPLSGGTGTGAAVGAQSWKVVTGGLSYAAGSGYTSAPAITLATPTCYGTCVTSYPATMTTSLNSVLTLSAGIGQVLMNNAGTTLGLAGSTGQVLLNATGTTLGVNGTTGTPIVMAAAQMDNSGTRQALSGTAVTLPANGSFFRFSQTATVTTQTINLPTATGDGQVIEMVSYGAISFLTFSPAVTGFTNGTNLAANTHMSMRWDATSGVWEKE